MSVLTETSASLSLLFRAVSKIVKNLNSEFALRGRFNVRVRIGARFRVLLKNRVYRQSLSAWLYSVTHLRHNDLEK
jgi:hypothetical protein